MCVFVPVGGASVTSPGKKQDNKTVQKPKKERSSFQNTYNLHYLLSSLSFIPFFSISVMFIGLRVALLSHNYGEIPVHSPHYCHSDILDSQWHLTHHYRFSHIQPCPYGTHLLKTIHEHDRGTQMQHTQVLLNLFHKQGRAKVDKSLWIGHSSTPPSLKQYLKLACKKTFATM